MPAELSLTNELRQLATERTFIKGAFLAMENERCDTLYFLTNGIVRYFNNLDGKEITTFFAVEEEFVTTTAFFTGQPSRESIEALEPVTALCIRRHQLHALYVQQPAHERFGRLLVEQHLTQIETLYLVFARKSAHERYRLMLNQYPYLVQRVPLGHLASFLGMAQETLSRIRAKRD